MTAAGLEGTKNARIDGSMGRCDASRRIVRHPDKGWGGMLDAGCRTQEEDGREGKELVVAEGGCRTPAFTVRMIPENGSS